MADGILAAGGSLGRAIKKTRMRSDEPLDLDNPIVDEQGRSVPTGENLTASWKDKLLGSFVNKGSSHDEEDFKLNDGDVSKEMIDGVPSITFSERVHNFITQRLARTVIVKLLGRKISYHAMSNKLQAIWKANKKLQVLDLKNDYFSVRFQDENEYITTISGGPWIIFGHYLMVRPWTRSFSTDQAFPNNLLVWVRLPGLLEGMYNTSLLKFIGGVIGPVARIDQNTDNKARRKFARITVFVDLDQPLVSKIVIDGRIQRVEYESLPVVCFDCGRYGHNREIYPYRSDKENEPFTVENPLPRNVPEIPKYVEEDRYGPWMLVERKQRRKNRPAPEKPIKDMKAGESKGSRFESLSEIRGDNLGGQIQDINGGI
ncbi:hypothetical protein PVK06_030222 [Gossypium arboreum]|uniref:DUF4283 domain-containing protein n=1 Tax=Gossypium arboreum TaxID=29729 RepID=A0ABR0NMQ0_GOSAR|nr:hypothetical protein PVK06_030222 [Gossypium arboreum]